MCYDNYYTIDWLECIPLPYPLKLTNYNNEYLILEFSQPVAYNTMTIEDLVTVSISGSEGPYNISWAMPYWSKN